MRKNVYKPTDKVLLITMSGMLTLGLIPSPAMANTLVGDSEPLYQMTLGDKNSEGGEGYDVALDGWGESGNEKKDGNADDLQAEGADPATGVAVEAGSGEGEEDYDAALDEWGESGDEDADGNADDLQAEGAGLAAGGAVEAGSGEGDEGELLSKVQSTDSLSKGEQIVTASDVTVAVGRTAAVSAATTGDGGLTYRSSDTSVVKVGKTTGKLTPVRAGTATITVTAAETDAYKKATRKVTVTVTSPRDEDTAIDTPKL